MVTLITFVEIPENRTITLTLPPETPVGAAELRVTVASPETPAGPMDDAKFNREWKAFHDMLPELLRDHPGKFVAIHEGRVVGFGDDGSAVSSEAHRRFGNVPIVVKQVTSQPRVVRIGPSIRRVRP